LKLDAPESFAAWASAVSTRRPDVRSWVTIDDVNRWPVERWLPFASGTKGNLATGRLLRAFDHQLAAHALAAAVLPGETSVGIADDDDYELAALLRDVLGAPGAGVPRAEIGPYLAGRRAEFVAAHPVRSVRRRIRRRLVASAIPLEKALPRSIAAVYEAGLVARSTR
jgi:hypothetical protein